MINTVLTYLKHIGVKEEYIKNRAEKNKAEKNKAFGDIYIKNSNLVIRTINELNETKKEKDIKKRSDRQVYNYRGEITKENGEKVLYISWDEWAYDSTVFYNYNKKKGKIWEDIINYNLGKINKENKTGRYNNFITLISNRYTIKEIKKKKADGFLNKYHLEGEDKSTIQLGAFENKDLIGVMTFKKNKNCEFKTSRYTEKNNLMLMRGIHNFHKYFKENYNFNLIK